MRSPVFSAVLGAGIMLTSCQPEGVHGPDSSADAALLHGGARSHVDFTYTVIDVPGSLSTVAWGINGRGDIVGSYTDAARRSHGFVMHDGEFTTIDYPGAAGTDARGIGPNGEIVGGYWMPGEPAVNIHGYLWNRDGFTRIDYPGHTNTIPQRILPDGTILGCRHDHDMMTTMHGVTVGPKGVSEISAFASMHNGGTPDGGTIVGLYTNMGAGNRTEGYVITDGVFTPFVVPGSNFTAAWDMNPAGNIVGVYRNAAGFHGFMRHDGEYLTLDVPGATATRAFGINPRGMVVGSFVAGGRTRGFLATPDRRANE